MNVNINPKPKECVLQVTPPSLLQLPNLYEVGQPELDEGKQFFLSFLIPKPERKGRNLFEWGWGGGVTTVYYAGTARKFYEYVFRSHRAESVFGLRKRVRVQGFGY